MMLTDGQYSNSQLRHQKGRAMKALGIIQQRLEDITRQELALEQQQQQQLQQQAVVSTVANSSGMMAGAATASTGGSGGGSSNAVAGDSSGSSMLACVDELADDESDTAGNMDNYDSNEVCILCTLS
jgi:hypothetical protein